MRNILLLSGLLLIIFSCEKYHFDKEIPNCIKEKITNFKDETVCQDGASVTIYTFQNASVYAFETGNCVADYGTPILNENCDTLCTLGTLLGITDCNGEPFSNATFERVVWEN